MAAAAAAMAVAAAAAMAVAAAAAATPLVAATSAGSPLDAEVAAGSEVAPASGLLDAEVAARSELVARSEVAAGSEVAGAAAAGSGSVTSGGPMIGGPGGHAAHPGERAACAKSHDLAAGLSEDAVVWLEALQATAFVNIVVAWSEREKHYCPDAGAVRAVRSEAHEPRMTSASANGELLPNTKVRHKRRSPASK